jgi:methyl-accepting chemotaxis protein
MLSVSALETKYKPPADLAVRINELSENLTRSGALIAEISAEMELQTAAFERISAEAEQNRNLASLHQDEADAVRRVIENTQKIGAKIAGRQQWLFFLGGIPVGVIVNFIYGYLTH